MNFGLAKSSKVDIFLCTFDFEYGIMHKITLFKEKDMIKFFGGPLSQWYSCKFTVESIEYSSAEQFMMHQKAMLFGDTEIAQCIMWSNSPAEQKKLGKAVYPFDDTRWMDVAEYIVTFGNLAKFLQNPHLIIHLGTDELLVECSGKDQRWGIGLWADDTLSNNPETWRGDNLLGKCLMKVRGMINESKHAHQIMGAT